MNQPIFESVNQALTVQQQLIARLASLVLWSLLLSAHLVLIALLAFLAWWFQVAPADVSRWAADLTASSPAKAFAALGGSLATAMTAYAWLLRRIHRAVYTGPIVEYLMRHL